MEPYTTPRDLRATEPNETKMLAKHFEDFGGIYNIEEPYGLVLHAGGHGVELQALVAFTDLKVVQSSNGCFWNGRCCEPTSSRWIGTAQQWIGAFALGIRSPLESASTYQVLSMHETWTSSTSHCVACSWTLMCSSWTYSMLCVSSWPITSCIALFLLIAYLGIKFNRKARRRTLKQRMSRLSQYRGPRRKPCRWDGTLVSRWSSYIRMKGLVFLLLYTQASAMDAAQATDRLGRIMELSTAATTAANKANQMLEAYNAAGGKGSQAPRLGDV